MQAPPPPPPPPMPPTNRDPHVLEANGRFGGKPESPFFIVLLNVVNTVTQLLIGAIVISAVSMANLFMYTNSMSQHIYLCVFGYVLLMSQAILSFNSHAGWAYNLKYPDKKLIHSFMQISGSALAIVGSVVRIIDVDEHFNTPHAITGMIALIFTCLSLIGGILNFVLPRQTGTVYYKTIHSCFGCLTISVAYISLCLGFNDWYRYLFGDVNADLVISFTAFALVGILLSAFARISRRIASGEL